jgi:hypothetical protein
VTGWSSHKTAFWGTVTVLVDMFMMWIGTNSIFWLS